MIIFTYKQKTAYLSLLIYHEEGPIVIFIGVSHIVSFFVHSSQFISLSLLFFAIKKFLKKIFLCSSSSHLITTFFLLLSKPFYWKFKVRFYFLGGKRSVFSVFTASFKYFGFYFSFECFLFSGQNRKYSTHIFLYFVNEYL